MRGKGKSLAWAMESNPNYRLSWRLRRAMRLSVKDRLRKLALDDEATYRAARYLRRRIWLSTTMLPTVDQNKRLIAWDAEVYAVLRIQRDERFSAIKRSLKLRMVSGQDDFAIEQATAVAASIVGLFHDLCFAIRPLLPYPDAMHSRILGYNLFKPLNELTTHQLQLLYAYKLGASNIDLLLLLGESNEELEAALAKSARDRQTEFWQSTRLDVMPTATGAEVSREEHDRQISNPLRVA